ncbi:MAG: helix-turn-helix domain-containing protein [Microbacteriaceae bacterium]|nr:helix-turn-helix domain-containing protein [Microbacteriaceae bacterium]
MDEQRLVELDIRGVEEWRSTVTSLLLPLAIETDDPDGFRASIRTVTVGGVRVYRISASSHRSARTERLLTSGGDPFYAVVHQVAGTSRIHQFENSADLVEGDFALYDTTSPYRREFPEGTTLVMLVPQQLLNLPPRAFAQIAALRIPGDRGIGAIASPLLGGVAANLPALLGPGGRAIMQSVVDVIGACVAELLGITAPTRSHTHLELLMQVREYIMGRLGETDLTPQRIAEEHFISVRTLHSLFKEQGTTVATWIRERRLEMARRDLIDPLCTDPIRLIGERWGFVDATHFSNAFRLAYGASPRSYRQAAQAVSQRAGDA